MRQVFQNLKTGEVSLPELPAPRARRGHLVVRTSRSLVSLGTERMLLEFGRASWLGKARQQPEKVRQVLDKVRTDGVVATLDSVRAKLDQPLALGYSNVGRVVEVGEGVTGFEIGDRVVSNGPHAELVCVPEQLCARVPDGVSDAAAGFTVVAAIALQGVRLVDPTLGETVVVMGLGLIGQLAVQVLRANGCRVVGLDVDADKVATAQGFGADAYVVGGECDPVALVEELTGGVGADAVLITASTRSNDPIHQAPAMCRKRGRVVLVGVVGLELDRADFYAKEIRFQVSCSYGPGRYDPAYEERGLDYPIGFVRWTEQRNFEAILGLLAEGRLDVEPLVTRSVPFHRAPELYETLGEDRGTMGVLLEYPETADFEERTVPVTPREPARGAGTDRACLGVIGAGAFTGAVLLPGLKKTGARLKTIVSAGGANGRHLAEKFGVEQATVDADVVLDDPAIDAVVVATRHDSHAELVTATLARGKHVFVEKPLAIDAASLGEVVAAYREQENEPGRPAPILMVGFNRRFAPLVVRLRELLARTRGPRSIVYTVNAGAIPPDHWTQDTTVGGGRLVGEGCHFVDLLRFVASSPIASTNLVTTATPTRDTFTLSLAFENGSIGTVHYFANGHRSLPKERLEVFADGRVLQLDNFRTLRGHGWKDFRKHSLRRQDKGHAAELAAFVRAVQEGRPSPIPFDELVEVSRAVLAPDA